MSRKDGARDAAARTGRRRPASPTGPVFAALDLGTNNCRLLVAAPSARGFRVVESYSKIIRLGEGLSASGRLSDAAMDRALEALRACARIAAAYPRLTLRCIATQACRIAENGEAFLAEVKRETGLAFEIVTAQEEARLSVLGCAGLIDAAAAMALVIDIGGGSTELSWVEGRSARTAPNILAWTSLPLGVVTLAERLPETGGPDWYGTMMEEVAREVRAFAGADALRPAFAEGRAHVVGTSGAVSSLAGVHLELPRYQRSKVDGLWMHADEVKAVAARLRSWTPAARAANPCIGPERADLVTPGAAILEAVWASWPTERVRVADRGLREGVLLELMGAL